MVIIAVDDNRDDLDLLSDLIYDASPDDEILEFDDPLAALSHARENEVDVAFLDADMPELGGLELGRYLKELNPKVNIILLSHGKDESFDALSMHASGYILKPSSPLCVETELQDLRYPEFQKEHKRVFAQTFGNFE
ncbi:MAG: response regulator, partial [Lachnospiraceae bacterium]|nr:response regulator [Lachnospiraceae bacterium]